MAQTAVIEIVDFDLQMALAGTPVTLLQAIPEVGIDMSTQTGLISKSGSFYALQINGNKYLLNEKGVVAKGTSVGTQAHNVEAQMITTYGTEQGMTRGVGLGVRDLGVVSNLEPRDQFAILAMETMITHLDHPESVNDSTILLFSRAAYRWAQGMMIVAADNRSTVPVVEDTSVEVDQQSLNSNTEKLLNNIVDAVNKLTAQIKNKVAIANSTSGDLETKVTGSVEVTYPE